MIQSAVSMDDARLKAESYIVAEEMIGIGTWQLNLDNGVLRYSDNLFRIFGYHPGSVEPSLELYYGLVHPDDIDRVQAQAERVFATKVPVETLYRIVRPDGNVRHLRGKSKLVTTDSGDRILVGATQDITEDFIRQQSINARNRFSESLLDNAVDAIMALDNNLVITAWNRQCELYYDIPREQILGRKLLDVFPHLQHNGMLKQVERARAGEFVHQHEVVSSITGRTSELFLAPLRNEQGVVEGVLSVSHDITDEVLLRKSVSQQKEFLESVINNSVDIVIALDTSLHFTLWNRQAERRYNMKSEDVLGKSILNIFPGYETSALFRSFGAVLAGHESYVPESPYWNGGGYYEAFLVPLRDAHGNVTGVLVKVRDISERKLATERLEQSYREVQRSNRELSSFAYVASHDLREPLRKIQVFADRILAKEAGQLSDTGKDYFRRMQNAASRMDTLIDDLLSFSRMGTVDQTFDNVDLNELLNGVTTDLALSIAESGAQIQADALPTARVIPFQIRQVFQNLISNSIKFRHPERPLRVNIASERIAGTLVSFDGPQPNKSYLRIDVSDNGIGFEQEYSERIFELFQRLHGKNNFPGTGIGLSVCKKIAENHGGSIVAIGGPGEGSKFSVYIQEL